MRAAAVTTKRSSAPQRHCHHLRHLSRGRAPGRAGLLAGAFASDASAAHVCVEDSALCDYSSLTVAAAWRAARQLWGEDRVPGASPQLYLSKCRSVLPHLSHAYEAVVLLRLLADEGVIGGCKSARLHALGA